MSGPGTVEPSSTIGQAWDSYRAVLIPSDASAVQIRESRRAFYAGAAALLDQMLRIEAGPLGVAPTDEDLAAGADRVEALRLELVAFRNTIGRGN